MAWGGRTITTTADPVQGANPPPPPPPPPNGGGEDNGGGDGGNDGGDDTSGEEETVPQWTFAEMRAWLVTWGVVSWAQFCAAASAYTVAQWVMFFQSPAGHWSPDEWTHWWLDDNNWRRR